MKITPGLLGKAPFVPHPHQLTVQEGLASQLACVLAVGAQLLQGWAGERRQGLVGGRKSGSLWMMGRPQGQEIQGLALSEQGGRLRASGKAEEAQTGQAGETDTESATPAGVRWAEKGLAERQCLGSIIWWGRCVVTTAALSVCSECVLTSAVWGLGLCALQDSDWVFMLNMWHYVSVVPRPLHSLGMCGLHTVLEFVWPHAQHNG